MLAGASWPQSAKGGAGAGARRGTMAGRGAARRRAVLGGAGAAGLAGLGFAAGLAGPLARPARAILPDDDDMELIARARAKRQQRIEDEFENGRSFAATEGFSASLGASQKSIAEVQRAVNALSDAGAALSSGDLGQAQSAAGGGWVQDFQSAAVSLDSTAKLSGEYETVVKGLGGIQNARDVDSARQSFVVAVTALQGWAADTGIASKLEGL